MKCPLDITIGDTIIKGDAFSPFEVFVKGEKQSGIRTIDIHIAYDDAPTVTIKRLPIIKT